MGLMIFLLALLLLGSDALFAGSDAATVPQTVIAEHHTTITAPPDAQAVATAHALSQCSRRNVFGKRANSCSFGQCGNTCLAQGAFCCGPAGTLATAPIWICDNGACITSVRGTTGVVDCYDPDNPSGTTQSCIDHVPTTTCEPTDRCYTCSSDAPYCHWQTYIGEAPTPTLKWFSCIDSSTADETFFASTITNNLLSPSQAVGGGSGPALSNGAIAGISAGGAVFVIAFVALLIWAIVRYRKKKRLLRERLDREEDEARRAAQEMAHMPPVELASEQERQSVYYDERTGTWKLNQHPTEMMSTPVAELPASLKRPYSPARSPATEISPVRTPMTSEEDYRTPVSSEWPLRSPPRTPMSR